MDAQTNALVSIETLTPAIFSQEGGIDALAVSARTDGQAAAEAAGAALDDVSGGGVDGEGRVDWAAAVGPAADALERAGLGEAAAFVRAAAAG